MMLIPTLITLTTIHCIIAVSRSKREDEDCTTPDGLQGYCINIRSCQPIFSLLRKAAQDPEIATFLRKSKCGGYAEVCCPRKTKNKSPNQFSGLLVDGCGKKTISLHNRIVGGVPVSLGAWPWIAALGYKDMYSENLKWRCGGSLINNRYVLTAAHCISDVRNPSIFSLILVKVRLGEHNLRSNSDGTNPVDYDIENTIVHKESKRNDIALIRLNKNIVFTDQIKPICLPEAVSLRSSSFVGMYPFVVGWGKTSFGGSSSDIPLQVQVPVVDNDSCKKVYAKIGDITENHICAGEKKGGKDSCMGDSGGPLMLPQNGTYYQIGIISAGHLCAEPGHPGVYTRVTAYLDWINKNIE